MVPPVSPVQPLAHPLKIISEGDEVGNSATAVGEGISARNRKAISAGRLPSGDFSRRSGQTCLLTNGHGIRSVPNRLIAPRPHAAIATQILRRLARSPRLRLIAPRPHAAIAT